MKNIAIIVAAVLGSTLVVVACENSSDGASGASSSPLTESDRRALVQQSADGVVGPTTADYLQRTQQLEAELNALCDNPNSQTLGTAQVAWDQARAVWKRGDAFAFGPYGSPDNIGLQMDFWPVREDRVDDFIEDNDDISAEKLASSGSTVRGLPVIEYHLFSVEDPANLTGKRCQHIRALGEDLVNLATEYQAQWDDHRRALKSAGASSDSVYPAVEDALSQVFNHIVFAIDDIRFAKLGKPLGKSGGTVSPGLVESPFSERSVADMLDSLDGVEQMYTIGENTSGISFEALVRSRNPALAEAVAQAFDESRQALDAIDAPLQSVVLNDPDRGDVAYDEIKVLHRLLAVDVANVVGVTVRFNDTDAD